MSYRFVRTSSGQYITAPTLGNILTLTTLRIEFDAVVRNLNAGDGYLISQATSTAGNREFGILEIGGDIDLYWGGDYTSDILTNAEAVSEFGSAVIDADIAFEFDVSAATYEIFKAGSATAFKSGSFSAGSNRTNGTLLRFGARSYSDTPSSTSGTFTEPSGTKVGDTRIYTNGTKIRDYVSDGSGSTWEEGVASNDGTLQNYATDGTQWESYGTVVTNISPTAIASAGAFGTPSLTLGTVTLLPSGITSLEAFGNSVIEMLLQNILASGTPSGEAFGNTRLTGGDVLLIPTAQRQSWNAVAAYLRTFSFKGSDNDVIIAWLRSEGIVDGTYNDLWNKYLLQNGFTALTLADNYAAWRQNTAELNAWILAVGNWNDTKIWIDNETWRDN